jgi:hypothetical protein
MVKTQEVQLLLPIKLKQIKLLSMLLLVVINKKMYRLR